MEASRRSLASGRERLGSLGASSTDTIWADGPMESVDVDAIARERGEPPREPREGDREIALARALELVGSGLKTDQVHQIITRSENPSSALMAILADAKEPPSSSAVERLIPVIMDMWNELPRPELSGFSSEGVHMGTKIPSPRPGRNDPCPCGSGAKYKRCCLPKALH